MLHFSGTNCQMQYLTHCQNQQWMRNHIALKGFRVVTKRACGISQLMSCYLLLWHMMSLSQWPRFLIYKLHCLILILFNSICQIKLRISTIHWTPYSSMDCHIIILYSIQVYHFSHNASNSIKFNGTYLNIYLKVEKVSFFQLKDSMVIELQIH